LILSVIDERTDILIANTALNYVARPKTVCTGIERGHKNPMSKAEGKSENKKKREVSPVVK